MAAQPALTDTELESLMKIRDDLYVAMRDGEVVSRDGQAVKLTCNLVSMAFPQFEVPEYLDAFSFIVGSIIGSASQKHEEFENGV